MTMRYTNKFTIYVLAYCCGGIVISLRQNFNLQKKCSEQDTDYELIVQDSTAPEKNDACSDEFEDDDDDYENLFGNRRQDFATDDTDDYPYTQLESSQQSEADAADDTVSALVDSAILMTGPPGTEL